MSRNDEPLPFLRPANGKGWLGASGAPKGLTCKQGGPHHIGMPLDGCHLCLFCQKPMPKTERGGPPMVRELLHPMREPIRAKEGVGAYGRTAEAQVVDVARRRAGDDGI